AVALNWKSDDVEGLVHFWRSSESAHAVRDVVTLLASQKAVGRGDFDSHKMLIGVKNGIVDLETFEFRESERELLMTKEMNASYNESAACPLWEKFLQETTGGDTELQRYLQQCAGVCLTGLVDEHVFFIVLGPGGTGKSTFQETLKFVWGTYSVGINPESLAMNKNRDGSKPRPDIAKLPGARLVFANESRAGLQLDEGLLKSMTGSDTLSCRQLYEPEFDFVPQYKLWLRTNAPPSWDGGDSGMRRRVKLVPFVCVPVVKDPTLPKKLRKEADGILMWALRGLKDYRDEGCLVEPKVVTDGSREYADTLDPIRQFIQMGCIQQDGIESPAQVLYVAYCNWCAGEHRREVSINRFASELKAKGYQTVTHNGRRFWVGLSARAKVPGVVVEDAQ
ncbi:MAG: phage/plasmid primase, P4 family, partial [Terriglobales bacterium]